LVAQQIAPDSIQVAYERRVQDEPTNPELFFQIAVEYWDRAYRDTTMDVTMRRDMIAKGLVSVDRALTLKPDYREALVYKSLLVRLQASIEGDPTTQQILIQQADGLRDRAEWLDPRRR
jgi:hypothetical protein